MDGFAIGTLSGQASNAGFSKADGMACNGGRVQILCDGIKEADGWDVDSGLQWPGNMVVCLHGSAAVGRAVLGIVQGGIRIEAVGVAA